MIEKALDTVKICFTDLESVFGEDQGKEDAINDLENQLEAAKIELKLTKTDLENQIGQLKEQLLNTKEIVALELEFKFEDEKKSLLDNFKKAENQFDEEIKHLKTVLAEREIDESRFTELNKTINDRMEVSKEIEDIRESMKSQIQLKEDELDDLRGAIGHFQKALEDSRMREMEAKMS